MRQIEFRGLRTDGKGWIYGDLLHNHWTGGDTFTPCAIRYLIGDLYSHPIEVRPETVGQFTGLHDKSGNKIFEGDVILCVDYGQQVNGVIVADLVRSGYMVKWLPKTDFNDCIYVRLDSITIIGNIHEHPELINK